jgi:hypothetical protein
MTRNERRGDQISTVRSKHVDQQPLDLEESAQDLTFLELHKRTNSSSLSLRKDPSHPLRRDAWREISVSLTRNLGS